MQLVEDGIASRPAKGFVGGNLLKNNPFAGLEAMTSDKPKRNLLNV